MKRVIYPVRHMFHEKNISMRSTVARFISTDVRMAIVATMHLFFVKMIVLLIKSFHIKIYYREFQILRFERHCFIAATIRLSCGQVSFAKCKLSLRSNVIRMRKNSHMRVSLIFMKDFHPAYKNRFH